MFYSTNAVLGTLTFETLPRPHRRKNADWPPATFNDPGLPGPILSLPISFPSSRRSWTPQPLPFWRNVAPAAAYKSPGFVDPRRPTHMRVLRTSRWALPWQTLTGPCHMDLWPPGSLCHPSLLKSEFPLDLDSHTCPFNCPTALPQPVLDLWFGVLGPTDGSRSESLVPEPDAKNWVKVPFVLVAVE